MGGDVDIRPPGYSRSYCSFFALTRGVHDRISVRFKSRLVLAFALMHDIGITI